MALHEPPPRRSNHREAIAMDLVPRPAISSSIHVTQPSRAPTALSSPFQAYSSQYRLDATSYRRSPVGSSASLCAPVVADPSPMGSTHRFDMKRMLSKPASPARPLSSTSVRPKTAPSPSSSPDRLPVVGISQSRSSSELSSLAGSGPSSTNHDCPAGRLTPSPRIQRTLSFTEPDELQVEERKPSGSGQFSSPSHRHRNPPISTPSSQRPNGRVRTPSPPIESQMRQPFPTIHDDDTTRRGFLSSISPQLHSATGPAPECSHMAEAQENPSPSHRPSQPSTIHAPSMFSDLTSHSSHSPRKEASTSPSSISSSDVQPMTSQSPFPIERVRMQVSKCRLSQAPPPSHSEPPTPKIDPYAAVDYVPAGPRGYTPATASVAVASVSSNRSPVRYATAMPSATSCDQQVSCPERTRTITTNGTDIEPIPSMPTSVPLDTSSSSQGNRDAVAPSSLHSSQSPTKRAGPNGPCECAREHQQYTPSTSTPIATELNISTPTVASQGSSGSTTTSVEEDGQGHRTLTRKLSRKLLKRPKKLDLEPSGVAGATIPVTGSSAGPSGKVRATGFWIDCPSSFIGYQVRTCNATTCFVLPCVVVFLVP